MVYGIVGRIVVSLEGRNRGIKLCGGDFFGGGVKEAELAGREITVRSTHRRAKRAANDGTGFVEITSPGCRIEHRAGFGIADTGFAFVAEKHGLFIIFVEDAGRRIAWKDWGNSSKRIRSAGADIFRTLGGEAFESTESFPQASSVLVGDREDSMTTLCATGAANKVKATALNRRCVCGVYDLDKR